MTTKKAAILNPKKPGRYQDEYKGIRYSVVVGQGTTKGVSVYQGYDDDGIRIIYAISAKEFKKKVDERDHDMTQRNLFNEFSKHKSFRDHMKKAKRA